MIYPNNNSNTDDKFLMECVEIDQFSLDKEYTNLPGQLAYWNGQYADVYRAHQMAKLRREQEYRRLFSSSAAYLRASNPKTTVGDIEAAVEGDPGYSAVRTDEVELEAETRRLAGVCEAMRGKLQMLISLGAHIRAEMGNDPSVRAQRTQERTAHSAENAWPVSTPPSTLGGPVDDDPLLR